MSDTWEARTDQELTTLRAQNRALRAALLSVLADYEHCMATGDVGRVWKANIKHAKMALKEAP